MLKFSLVSTVFNEARRLELTINDLEQQTLKPSEILITDAGSKDGTYELLLAWKQKSTIPIVILQKERCNVAEGRNIAIKNAKYDLIASTDFGCRFNPSWLNDLMSPFVNNDDIKVVGGAYGVRESDINTLAEKSAYLIYQGYQAEASSARFIPSSRSIAYRKKVWEDVGGYCEWLTLAADDYIFGQMVRNKGYNIYISENCNVFWGRHSDAMGYAKESFRYGIGDGETLSNKRNFYSNLVETLLRYSLFVALPIIILLTIFLPASISPLYLLILLPLSLGLRSYYKVFKNWWKLRSEKYNLRTLTYAFYIIEICRVYYFKGWLKGFKRKSNDKKEEYKLLQESLKDISY